MIFDHLHTLFSKAPFEKRYTASQIKQELYRSMGYELGETEFSREFRRFQDITDLPIAHIKEISRHRYLKTENPRIWIKHNALLSKLQRNAEKRKRIIEIA